MRAAVERPSKILGWAMAAVYGLEGLANGRRTRRKDGDNGRKQIAEAFFKAGCGEGLDGCEEKPDDDDRNSGETRAAAETQRNKHNGIH